MTAQTEIQIGKFFRDLNGSVVHLKGIHNEICIWTAKVPTSEGAFGGATHVNNFQRRFVPVLESQPEWEMAFVTPPPAALHAGQHE